MDELLHECKQQNKYDAAGKVQKVLELLEAAGLAGAGAQGAGEAFLQSTPTRYQSGRASGCSWSRSGRTCRRSSTL